MRREELSVRLETEWRDRIARQAISGKNVAAFCRSECVTESSFYGWRSRLGLKHTNDAHKDSAVKIPLPFIDLGPIKQAANTHSTPPLNNEDHGERQVSLLDIRLELGNGIVLHMTRR